MADIPDLLKHVEFSLVSFRLEFLEPCRYDMPAALRLRRDLRAAAGFAMTTRNGGGDDQLFRSLFDPPLPADPLALRRYQRPGPPFAFLPRPANWGDYEAGDCLDLEFSFWGKGIQQLAGFARVLAALGRAGLHMGQGPFELIGIGATDPAGTFCPLWIPGEDPDALAPPIQDACWWLETVLAEPKEVVLEFMTPARLISRGRPLFRGNFTNIFPFILRRISSVAYAHCGIELTSDPKLLLDFCRKIEEIDNRLEWTDWRQLEGEVNAQELGGLMGSVKIGGDKLGELAWILQLGSLMNLGKGAAFGAGNYRLRSGSDLV